MIILNKNPEEITFEDVEEFCKENHIEGIQLDYKKSLPRKGLAKHFASFSNTRGGVIIIGVEEDPKTGSPLKWEGIEDSGKLIDTIHQYASNVEPIPRYVAVKTNEKKSKVFIIVRIFEGGHPPYYVQNDSNIWVRTGNISSIIDIASPDTVELMFGKRDEAELARSRYVRIAKDVYQAGLARSERERLKDIAIKKEGYAREQNRKGITEIDWAKFKSGYYGKKLGSEVIMCTITIQPFYPRLALSNPTEIKGKVPEIRVRGNHCGDFPSLSCNETIPEGVMSFKYGYDGSIHCEQIYSKGLIYNSADVLRINDGIHRVFLSGIARLLYITLFGASSFFSHFKYQGTVIGEIELSGLKEDTVIDNVLAHNRVFDWDIKTNLLNEYSWDLITDTAILNSQEELRRLFIEKLNEIFVSFNYAPSNESEVEKFLQEEGWSTKDS
ncbi:hypothetical protein CO058_00570 [candidate division WWE3 bacterium CG_4_9_14_0_2_um_filter_35_11]|uniref:Schlafen AlbA-2 domain-containing protein n=1 Tax=candidate division WWE3 bacterium CG_4_9_14_0_2_um_filter_35_11 TaxID=1975077 RepID=A0A2M8EML3_UNCKA|nr:MAG: hypothetical protein CO058_00570 [candidate division WWE3 bacterium CG_4_9_14_0_2_um_filter_35_11]